MDAEERQREEMARRRRLMRGEPITELRSLPEAQLSERHDALMELSADPSVTDRDAQLRYVLRAQVYNDELTRRVNERLTKWIIWLTVIITIATIVGVFLAWAGA
jgi:hypothetical protein